MERQDHWTLFIKKDYRWRDKTTGLQPCLLRRTTDGETRPLDPVYEEGLQMERQDHWTLFIKKDYRWRDKTTGPCL
jgi:hypothetical protein